MVRLWENHLFPLEVAIFWPFYEFMTYHDLEYALIFRTKTSMRSFWILLCFIKIFLGFPGSLKSSIPCFEEFLREIKDFYTDLTSISGTPLLHILPLIFFLFYIMIYIIFKRSRIRIRSAVQWRISSAICSLNLCWPTGYCQNSWPHFKTETKIWPRNASAT